MKVLILDDTSKAIVRAAKIVAAAVHAKPNLVLGLATGGTMLPLYQELCRLHRFEGLSFAGVTTFNLDEYVGLPPDHPCSYHRYMREALFDHIDIVADRTHLPRGDAADPKAEADAYDQQILASGGIDLQVLGIGRNGHIGFNEPSSSLGSRTRIKTLTEETRQANAQYFDRYEDIPRYAVTMGVGTILAAREIVLIATGTSKAEAVAKMVEGPVTASCPASALQFHANTTAVIDNDAATRLELTSYYHHVHARGDESVFG